MPRASKRQPPASRSVRSGRTPARVLACDNSHDDSLAGLLAATGSVCWEGSARPPVCDRLEPANGGFLGQPASRLIGRPWTGFVHAGDRIRVARFFARLPRIPLPASIEYRLGTPATAPRWVRHTILGRRAQAPGRPFHGVLTDISPLKHLELENLRVSEREQNRIGQDLHDDLCQVLAGLSCLTRVLENRLVSRVPEIDNLREINRQMVDAMERTRALTHGLFPAHMKSGDLRSTFNELAQQVQVRFGVTVTTRFSGTLPMHQPAEVLQVYRIAQESISNAIRHGQARHIRLALQRRRATMQLTVQDDGHGFPDSHSPHEGIGLQIMRHRASQLGGEVHVASSPPRGVRVVLHYQPTALL